MPLTCHLCYSEYEAELIACYFVIFLLVTRSSISSKQPAHHISCQISGQATTSEGAVGQRRGLAELVAPRKGHRVGNGED